MTPMPQPPARSPVPHLLASARKRPLDWFTLRWHVACVSIGCAGCLYLGPIDIIEDENVPPEIFESTPDGCYCNGDYQEIANALCLSGTELKVFTIATDADDDALEFLWSGSVSGVVEDASYSGQGDYQYSSVMLSSAEVYDGESLSCTVSDGSPNRVFREWTVVVVE